jgi:hypothetical protein
LEESGIVPSLVEDWFPVVHEAVGGGVAVELHGHCFDDEPDVDREGLEGAFGDLIGEGSLVDGHFCFDLGVAGGGMASHRWNSFLEFHSCLRLIGGEKVKGW